MEMYVCMKSTAPIISQLDRNLNAAIQDQQSRTLAAKKAALYESHFGLCPDAATARPPDEIIRLQKQLARLRHKMPPLGLLHETYDEAFADPSWWASRPAICPSCPPDLVRSLWRTIRQIEQHIRDLDRARRGVQRIPLHPRPSVPVLRSQSLMVL
jgi:hypothetical protein